MKITYGHEIKSDEDKFVELASGAIKALGSNPAGGTDIADILPFCMSNHLRALLFSLTHCLVCYIPSWFPGGGFKKRAERGKKLQQDLLELPYMDLKSRMVSSLREYLKEDADRSI